MQADNDSGAHGKVDPFVDVNGPREDAAVGGSPKRVEIDSDGSGKPDALPDARFPGINDSLTMFWRSPALPFRSKLRIRTIEAKPTASCPRRGNA